MDMNKESSFKDKLDEFWDTYKWFVIFGCCLVIGGIIFIFSVTDKTDYDITVLYTGSSIFSGENNAKMNQTSKLLAQDYNGDGELNIRFFELNDAGKLSDDGRYIYDTSILTSFNTKVRSCEYIIYILSPSFYQLLLDDGLLARLDELLEDVPDSAALDEYGLLFGALDISLAEGYKGLPADSVLCMRRIPSSDELQQIDSADYRNHIDFFNKLVLYTVTE